MNTKIVQHLTDLSKLFNVNPSRAGEAIRSQSLQGLQVSFEFFPPKTPESDAALSDVSSKLATLQPKFMTVTYGAGGTTRAKTHETAVAMQRATGIPIAAHLTCVGAAKSEIDAVADAFWKDGIRHIIALRGDMPGGAPYVPHPEGYPYTSFLIEGLKKLHNFEISVAAYPEKHPDATSLDADIDALKKKIDAGADRAISQFFFEPVTFLRFVEKARARGITQPIVPGILPIHNFSQVVKFAAQCGTKIPDHLYNTFKALDQDPETRKLVSAITAAEQCKVLHAMGVRHFHFYTLNKADLVYAVCHMLGMRAGQTASDTDQVAPQLAGAIG